MMKGFFKWLRSLLWFLGGATAPAPQKLPELASPKGHALILSYPFPSGGNAIGYRYRWEVKDQPLIGGAGFSTYFEASKAAWMAGYSSDEQPTAVIFNDYTRFAEATTWSWFPKFPSTGQGADGFPSWDAAASDAEGKGYRIAKED